MDNYRKGYKAFGHGMVCRGKQYAENTVFEEKGANACCEAGVIHYCENPLDVLNHYPLVDNEGRTVEVAEVEPQAKVLRKEDKCATKKLKIGAKLSLKDYITASIEFAFEKCKPEERASAELASSGYAAKIASSGKFAEIASPSVLLLTQNNSRPAASAAGLFISLVIPWGTAYNNGKYTQQGDSPCAD